FFNNTTQGAMDGNIKDTPPVLLVPAPDDRPRWDALAKELPEARKQADARKQAARADFDKWLAAETPDAMTTLLPDDGLRLHAPLSEGQGTTINLTVDGKPRSVALPSGVAWDEGHVAAKAFKCQPRGTVELADVGAYEK